ncbi:MAG: SlyX family protein [Desulfobacter postgatei]|nr:MULTISPECIES: SlyX family protein [Desulfobacter]MBP8829631.1 SlyX family protein [Desulfobacter sp.]MDD4275353.1 SlyX family protein [Desulfobacter postgatei]
MKIAFQEKAFNDLNQVLYDQQKAIDRLTSMAEILIKDRDGTE